MQNLMYIECSNFLNYSIPERIQLLISTGSSSFIYSLLAKHLHEDKYQLMMKYQITINTIRQRIFIKGGYSEIYELFQYLTSYGVKCESVTQTELRYDISELIYKIT